MKQRFFMFLLFMIVISSGISFADEETKDRTDITELDEVVVTAGRIKEKKKEIIANVTIIDKEEIQNSSAKDLGELLSENGVGYSKKYPGTSNVIGIRGFRTDIFGDEIQGHVLITVNGRRAGTGNAAKIMTKNIERVEIIRGPASVQYGSAAMGGVVNVITKRGTEEPEVFVEVLSGSHGYDEASAGFSGKVKNFDFSASFTRSAMNDYVTGDGDQYLNTGYDKKQDVNLNAGFEFFPKNRIGLMYSNFDTDHVGLPEYLSQQDLDDFKESGLDSFEIDYEGATSNDRFAWNMKYFQTSDEETNFDPADSDPSGYDDGIPTSSEADQKGGQVQGSMHLQNTTITAGSDWTHYDIEGDYAPQKSEYDNLAFFIFGKHKLFSQRLVLSGGLRYDDFTVEIIKPAGSTESLDNLSPKFGAAYLISDSLKVRANYGEAFSVPSAKQLAYDYMPGSIRYVGNPELKPEKSQTYELGIDYSKGSLNSSLTYFYTNFKDKIETIPGPGVDEMTWDNLGKATLEGIEGTFSYDVGSRLNWKYEVKPYVSIVYMLRYRDEETKEDLKETSDINASYGISISDYDGFSAKLNFAFTGEMTVTDYESGYPYRNVTKESFIVSDLTVKKRLIKVDRLGGLSLKGEIRNLFDENYSYAKGYPMPGRSLFLGLRYDY
ncbi:MAG: TonB-dependent receptor [Deltaproteobacteria bacterium]|nr:TonB-dependent receptor [Deltaproteobacteria bacterium]